MCADKKQSLTGHAMKWKENFSMKYGIVKVWNGMKKISILPYFSILAHFKAAYILSAVNKAAFDQIQKMMKQKAVAKGLFK